MLVPPERLPRPKGSTKEDGSTHGIVFFRRGGQPTVAAYTQNRTVSSWIQTTDTSWVSHDCMPFSAIDPSGFGGMCRQSDLPRLRYRMKTVNMR